MAMLTEKREHRKDGTTFVKGYSISLKKTKCEELGFNGGELTIEYLEDKIVIKKAE